LCGVRAGYTSSQPPIHPGPGRVAAGTRAWLTTRPAHTVTGDHLPCLNRITPGRVSPGLARLAARLTGLAGPRGRQWRRRAGTEEAQSRRRRRRPRRRHDTADTAAGADPAAAGQGRLPVRGHAKEQGRKEKRGCGSAQGPCAAHARAHACPCTCARTVFEESVSKPWHLNWSCVESMRRLAMNSTDLPWFITNAICAGRGA